MASRQARHWQKRHGHRRDLELDRKDGYEGPSLPRKWAKLGEDGMRHVDTVLDDPYLLDAAYKALARRIGSSQGSVRPR